MTFCNICRDDSFDYITSCGHYYHLECIKPWQKKFKSCPYCRMALYTLKTIAKACEVCRSGGSDFVTRCHHFIHKAKCSKHKNQCPICNIQISGSQIRELILSHELWTEEELKSLFPLSWLEIAVLACQQPRFHNKISFKFVLNNLIEDGFNINQIVFKISQLPLIGIASKNNNIEMIKELVSIGIDMQRFDHFPVSTAIKSNDLNLLNLLIEYGADVLNFVNKEPTFTLFSLNHDNPVVFDKLLEIGFDPKMRLPENENLLLFAVKNSQYKSVIKLVDRFKFDVNTTSKNNKLTALCHAIKKNDSKMVELLIEKGADLNIKLYGYSQYNCYRRRHFRLVRVVYELMKSDQKVMDTKIQTPLIHLIRSSGNLDHIDVSIEKAQDINQTVDSPLNYVFINDRFEIVKYLLNLDCSLNTLSLGYETLPIHDMVKDWSYGFGKESLFKSLIELGADVNGRENSLFCFTELMLTL